jgi:alpha-D-ribose 1-methylphosphonate 5-triphosphate diphosphatase
MQTLIHNATLVLENELMEDGWLLIEGEHILALGELETCPGQNGVRAIDGAGAYLLPGIIDLHCDAIEKLVEPRPNTHFPIALALQEADLRLASCGITCEFHAVSLDDNEFGVRSDNFIYELCQAIAAYEVWALVRHKIHARLELSSQRGSTIIANMIERHECDLVSLMDHSPGQGQYRTVEAFREYVMRATERNQEEVDELLAIKQEQAENIPTRITRVAQLAREHSITIATHDDDSACKVEQWPQLGVTVSEFPTTMEAALRAHELGMVVCMGAPNVLRGKSSGGNLSALQAIQENVASVLCSDYYPAGMLATTFALVDQGVLTLPAATRLVTLNPARAVGMADMHGSLTAGKIADLILVARNAAGFGRVECAFVGGRMTLSVGRLLS